jgi:tRNA(Glu) U13 pseudouridine synthase TruD
VLLEIADKMVKHNANGYRSVLGTDPERAVLVNPLSFRPAVNLGDLSGNDFEIVLRDLAHPGTGKAPDARHVEAMGRSVAEHGYVNYFGEQRTGDAGSVEDAGGSSYRIGGEILRGRWREAADMLMVGRKIIGGKDLGGDTDSRWTQARAKYREGRYREALELIQNIRNVKSGAEYGVLEHLDKFPGDYEGSIKKGLPYTQYNLFTRAYTSWVWNVMAGEKWAR